MDLIKFSREKGFLLVDELFTVNNYYLWMCELNKWLREKHNIHIEITKEIDFSDEKYGDRFEYIIVRSLFSQDISNIKYFDTYELALEEALYKSLTLIKSL